MGLFGVVIVVVRVIGEGKFGGRIRIWRKMVKMLKRINQSNKKNKP